MEKMPFRDQAVMDVNAVINAARATATTTETNWRQALPVLTGSMVTLRELRLSDAPSLISRRRRAAGTFICRLTTICCW